MHTGPREILASFAQGSIKNNLQFFMFIFILLQI
jgi:hypothetical protein